MFLFCNIFMKTTRQKNKTLSASASTYKINATKWICFSVCSIKRINIAEEFPEE